MNINAVGDLSIRLQLSMVGMIMVHALDAFTSPPARYPDLYTMGNVLVSVGVFFLCLAYFTFHQWRLNEGKIGKPTASSSKH